jgi:hypothetical protein
MDRNGPGTSSRLDPGLQFAGAPRCSEEPNQEYRNVNSLMPMSRQARLPSRSRAQAKKCSSRERSLVIGRNGSIRGTPPATVLRPSQTGHDIRDTEFCAPERTFACMLQGFAELWPPSGITYFRRGQQNERMRQAMTGNFGVTFRLAEDCEHVHK